MFLLFVFIIASNSVSITEVTSVNRMYTEEVCNKVGTSLVKNFGSQIGNMWMRAEFLCVEGK